MRLIPEALAARFPGGLPPELAELFSMPRDKARLLQLGLRSLGFYTGTTKGLPGARTVAAYEKYLESLGDPRDGQQDLASIVASLAEGEIGVREQPKDSNTGPRVRQYQEAATDVAGTNWAYCAAFVCWCILHAGRRVPLAFPRPTTALAYGFEWWAKKNGLEFTESPESDFRRGDIVIFNFSHIAIVTAPESGGRVPTVDGNTSPGSGDNEGGGVYRRNRRIKTIRSRVRLKLND